jgi:hypothetical protein
MKIVYAQELPNGIIIKGKDFIIIGTGKGSEQHGERVLQEARG